MGIWHGCSLPVFRVYHGRSAGMESTSFPKKIPEWLLDTKVGKRVGFTEGESCGQEVMETKAVESPD